MGNVTINNINITEIVKPGQTFSYCIPDGTEQVQRNMALSWNNADIHIQGVELPVSALDNIQQDYAKTAVHGPYFTGGSIHLQENTTFNVFDKFFKADDDIIISGEKIDIAESVLEAQKVVLASHQMELKIIIQAKILQIESMSEDSIIQIVQFILADDSEMPSYIEGHIDFENQCMRGDLLGNFFMVSNVKQVIILFNERIIPPATSKTQESLSHVPQTKQLNKNTKMLSRPKKSLLQRFINWLLK